MNAEGTLPRKAKAGNVIPFIFQIINSIISFFCSVVSIKNAA